MIVDARVHAAAHKMQYPTSLLRGDPTGFPVEGVVERTLYKRKIWEGKIVLESNSAYNPTIQGTFPGSKTNDITYPASHRSIAKHTNDIHIVS